MVMTCNNHSGNIVIFRRALLFSPKLLLKIHSSVKSFFRQSVLILSRLSMLSKNVAFCSEWPRPSFQLLKQKVKAEGPLCGISPGKNGALGREAPTSQM